VVEKFPALRQKPVLPPEHGLRGGRTQTDDEFGTHAIDLRIKPGLARSDFRRRRLLVETPFSTLFELEMFHRVGHIDFCAINAGLLQRAVEELPGGPDKGMAREVLFIPRLLTDHKDARMAAAFAEDCLRGIAIEVAPAAILHFGAKFSERGVGRDEFRRAWKSGHPDKAAILAPS